MKNTVLFLLLFFCLSGLLQAQNRPRLVLPIGQSSFYSTRFSPDGKYILSSDKNGSVTRIIEVASGKELKEIVGTLGWRGKDFSPDGKLMVTSSDTSLFLWDVKKEWNLLKTILVKNIIADAIIFEPRLAVYFLGNRFLILDGFFFSQDLMIGIDLI